MNKRTLTYEVIEDNGGGLHLFVFDNDNPEFYIAGFEYSPGSLTASLDSLDGGATLDDIELWDGLVDDPQSHYGGLIAHEYGWELVARNAGEGRELFPDAMGRAAEIDLIGRTK